MNKSPRVTNDAIFLEGAATGSKPRPAEGVTLRFINEYLERLRIYAPEEYAQIMKQRELRAKQRRDEK